MFGAISAGDDHPFKEYGFQFSSEAVTVTVTVAEQTFLF
jgi:hypothetical protein